MTPEHVKRHDGEYLMRLGQAPEPCPDCGEHAVVVSMWFEVLGVPRVSLAMPVLGANTPPPEPQVQARAYEAFALCFWCGRRERRGYNADDNKWQVEEVRDGAGNGAGSPGP